MKALLAVLVLGLLTCAAVLGQAIWAKAVVGNLDAPATTPSADGGYSADGVWWTNTAQTFFSNTVDHLTYGVVTGEDGKVWLDRNLGAAQIATNSADANSYGYLYQWGRLSDGHQIKTSVLTNTLSSTDVPGHGFFITNNVSPNDWRNPQNDGLWQGVSGTNNPSPPGFRLPTQSEWATYVSAAAITNAASAFSAALKLTVAGYRGYSSGSLSLQGSYGYYWSSSPNGVRAYDLRFSSSGVTPADYYYRAYGFTVRPVKN